MKHFFLILILFTFWSSKLIGQQISLTNLYSYNMQSINPAFSAISDFDAVYLNHRNQWTSLDKNPSTTFMAFNYSLNKTNGIGGNMYIDNLGLLRQVYAIGNYAHSFQIKNHIFSLATGFGIHYNSLNFSDIIVDDYTDDILINNRSTGLTYLTDMGAIYKYKDFMFGASSPRIIQSKINTSNLSFGLKRQINVFSSYNYKYNHHLIITPSILYRAVSFYNSQFDFNVDFNWGRTLSIGAGYRTNTAFLARVNGRVSEKFDISYSLENYFSKVGNIFVTQEISLAYKLYKTPDPKNNLD